MSLHTTHAEKKTEQHSTPNHPTVTPCDSETPSRRACGAGGTRGNDSALGNQRVPRRSIVTDAENTQYHNARLPVVVTTRTNRVAVFSAKSVVDNNVDLPHRSESRSPAALRTSSERQTSTRASAAHVERAPRMWNASSERQKTTKLFFPREGQKSNYTRRKQSAKLSSDGGHRGPESPDAETAVKRSEVRETVLRETVRASGASTASEKLSCFGNSPALRAESARVQLSSSPSPLTYSVMVST